MASVFISYRQLNDVQRLRVRTFAERVRGCGIDVVLDQFYKDDNPGASDDGWTIWSENQAEDTEKVLVIADHEWFQCYLKKSAPGKGLGAAAEAHIIHARITAAGTKARGIRIVAFDDDAKASIPFRLRDFPYFDLQQAGAFDEIIGWLGGTAVAVPAVPLTWPARCSTFKPDMANRDEEFAFFADTLCGTASQHATLISAATDHGKTRLVSEFCRYGCEVLGEEACCFVDFKARGTIDNLLDTIASDLGSRIPGLGDRSPSRLRDGLRKTNRPVLFVFDTFERATEEAREFVQSHFLAEMGKATAMRILLAGQPTQVPDPAKASWRQFARRFNLGSIEDPKPWVEWAARAFPLIPSAVVAAIAVSAGGTPGAIANQLTTLGTLNASQLTALGIQ